MTRQSAEPIVRDEVQHDGVTQRLQQCSVNLA